MQAMLDNCAIAVKRMSNTYMYEKEFHREVECLLKVKHRNIVRFLGYCADTQGNMARYDGKMVMADVQQRLLCFEYLLMAVLSVISQVGSCFHINFLYLTSLGWLSLITHVLEHKLFTVVLH